MKGFVVRTMLLSVCFLLCKLEVNNQCNQSPIESRNWNFLAFYEKVCWYNWNSIEKTVLRSNSLCQTWYYSQFGLYDNSTGVLFIKKLLLLCFLSNLRYINSLKKNLNTIKLWDNFWILSNEKKCMKRFNFRAPFQ